MSMIANYVEVDVDFLNSFINKSGEEQFEILDDLFYDENNNVCDLEKYWHSLHYWLTKMQMEKCDKKDLLYIFVFGEKELLDDPFIGILSPETVKRVVEKINCLDLSDFIKNFDPAEFERMDIYPDIWLREKREDLISCLVDSFNCLAEFYNEVGRNNKGIIMSIS